MPIVNDSAISNLLENIDPISGPVIYCRTCNNPITSAQQQTTIGHADHHRFTNPAGVNYHLRCFQHAPGCSLAGEPSEEFSWFIGYEWQLAFCGECNEHLGWYYQYKRSTRHPRFFFGLISDRLLEKHNLT